MTGSSYNIVILTAQHCHSDSTLVQHFQVCLLVWCSERSKSARAPRHDKAQKERAQNALKHYQGAATPPVRTIAPSLPSCRQSARMADVPQKGSLPEAPRCVQSSQNPSCHEVSRLDSTQIIDPCQKRPSPTDAIHANSSQPSDPLDNPQAAKGAVLDAGILDPSNAYANSSDMATMAKFPLTEARSATSRLSTNPIMTDSSASPEVTHLACCTACDLLACVYVSCHGFIWLLVCLCTCLCRSSSVSVCIVCLRSVHLCVRLCIYVSVAVSVSKLALRFVTVCCTLGSQTCQ